MSSRVYKAGSTNIAEVRPPAATFTAGALAGKLVRPEAFDETRSFVLAHAHPELSMQETRTAGLAAERLRAAGHDVLKRECECSVSMIKARGCQNRSRIFRKRVRRPGAWRG